MIWLKMYFWKEKLGKVLSEGALLLQKVVEITEVWKFFNYIDMFVVLKRKLKIDQKKIIVLLLDYLLEVQRLAMVPALFRNYLILKYVLFRNT